VQVRASVVDHPDTRGGISPERGDAWLRRRGRQPGSHVVTSREGSWPRTRNLRCRVHRNRHPNHQDAGLVQQPDAAAAPQAPGCAVGWPRSSPTV